MKVVTDLKVGDVVYVNYDRYCRNKFVKETVKIAEWRGENFYFQLDKIVATLGKTELERLYLSWFSYGNWSVIFSKDKILEALETLEKRIQIDIEDLHEIRILIKD